MGIRASASIICKFVDTVAKRTGTFSKMHKVSKTRKARSLPKLLFQIHIKNKRLANELYEPIIGIC